MCRNVGTVPGNSGTASKFRLYALMLAFTQATLMLNIKCKVNRRKFHFLYIRYFHPLGNSGSLEERNYGENKDSPSLEHGGLFSDISISRYFPFRVDSRRD